MKVRLVHPHSIFIEPPFLEVMDKTSGLLVPFNDGLPKIYARVTAVHPTCTAVRPGDVVTFASHCYERYYVGGTKYLYAMDERAVLGVIEDWL